MTIRVGKITFAVWKLGDGRHAFDYKAGSKRIIVARKKFTDLKAAAELVAIKIINGETEAIQLSPQDCRIHIAARNSLQSTGLEIDAVAREAADALSIAGGVSLRDLALFYKRNCVGLKVEKTVAEVTRAVRDTLKERSLSGRFIRDIENDCELRIDQWFGPRPIADVLPEEILAAIRKHQAEKKFGWRRRNHLRNSFVYVWNYAKKMHWLPQDRDTAAQRVEMLEEPKTRRIRNVYTPEALRMWIHHCGPDYLPWLLVCAFSTVRSEEVAPEPGANKDRLEWADFKWTKKYGEKFAGFSGVGCIHIRAEVSKVNEDRYVPLPDCLIAWLLPYRDRTGPVYPAKYPPSKRETARIGRATAPAPGEPPRFPWKNNVLRHTAISARLGLIKNRGQVAEEGGTSERRIRKNYNEGLDYDEAMAIYATFPDYSQKVLPLWRDRRRQSA